MNEGHTKGKGEPPELDVFTKLRESGDPAIRDRLITDNLYVVIPVARKFKTSTESIEDLIQVGYIGLIKAVDNFDPARGVKFITYATHCIMGEIRHYIRDKAHSIKRPRWLTKLNREMSEYVEKFIQDNERLPTLHEIATALNIESEGIIEVFKSKYVVSLSDYPEGASENLALSKIRSKKHESFRLPIEDRIVLEEAIEKLKILERKIIHLFFYQDLTQTQIAIDLGLSQKKVSRMLKKSIDKLRNNITTKGEST